MKFIEKEINEAISNFKRVEMDYIVRTNRTSDENEYLSFEVPIGDKIASKIKDFILSDILLKLEGLSLEKFNPTSTESGTIEFLPCRDVNNFDNIQAALKKVNKEPLEELKFDNIWGYSIKVIYGNGKESKEAIFFKKFSYPKLLNKSRSIVMTLSKEGYTEIEDKIITIDSVVHAFSLGDIVYILNKGQFEKFFNFSFAYQKVVNDSVATLEKLDVIENFSEFTRNCLNSDTLTRRLVKIITEERFENLQKNIENVPSVIDDFALNVKFEQNKIIYDENSTITDIITLIKGACVYGALDKQKYLANDTKSVINR